jgi:argininosuccinate lyase
MKPAQSTWGGRFRQSPAAEARAFTESVSFDHRLARYDIQGSIAHAKMLARIGVLTARQLKQITTGLHRILVEIETGKFRWNAALEDVHMNIESALIQRVPAGAKLHTGRSRNDQVALDVRLWLRDAISNLQAQIRNLQRALAGLAGQHANVVIPGYTHLQRAQPVLLAHHLLAYVEMLQRDWERFGDCRRRVNVCPLGSGALAGSTLALDRAYVAKLLGFDGVTQNSMDAVSDRDPLIEFCAHAAIVAMHLSRLAEDFILWASAEFGFIAIADA